MSTPERTRDEATPGESDLVGPAPASARWLLAVGMAAGAVLAIVGAMVGSRRLIMSSAARECETTREHCAEACDRSALRSCAHEGELAEEGKGQAPNPQRAVELYRRACDGKEPLGCARLASMLRFGLGGTSANPAEARRLASASCEAGEPLGCTLLAELQVRGGEPRR